MKIFMPSVHPRRTKGVASSLNSVGMPLYIAGSSFAPNVGVHKKYTQNEATELFGQNVYIYEGNEIFDNPPDIVISGREDSEIELFSLVEKIRSSKFCSFLAYSGNFHSHFNWEIYQGAICTDLATRMIARWRGIPAIEYRPAFSFDSFPYQPGHREKDIILRSYIQTFEERYPTAFKIHDAISRKYNSDLWPNVLIENVRDKSLSEVERLMRESVATIHIKDQEGFGWSVLESLSVGRPLILQSGLAKHMAMTNWAIHNETALYFEDEKDLENIVIKLRDDIDWRVDFQRKTASKIRSLYDFYSSARELGKFLEHMAGLEKYRWIAGVPAVTPLSKVHAHRPTPDVNFKQGFELIDMTTLTRSGVTIPGTAFYSRGRYTDQGRLEVDLAASRVVAWGPFFSLTPGRYKATLEVQGNQGSAVQFDMTRLVDRNGPEVLWQTDHTFSGEIDRISTTFSCNSPGDRFEFRTLSPGSHGSATVVRLHLEKS
nr:hypothetical protein [Brevundimonas diminuta]